MTLPAKYDSVRRYNVVYSKIILRLEIALFLLIFSSLFMFSAGLWLFSGLLITFLLGLIFFSSYSIIKQFPQGLVIEFRASPDRLIWYDSTGESSFPLQQVEVTITRWFVLLKLGKTSNQLNRVLFQDSFDDNRHYSSFRRQLLNFRRDDIC